jgi:arylsulfatase A-like enzyme
MDLYATVCETSGAAVPNGIDAVSFLPTLLGKPQADAKRDYYYTLREGGPQFGGKSIEAVRRGPWKLLQDRPFSPLELYNLDSDPGESKNVVDQNPAVARELSAALQSQFLRAGQVSWQPPEPNGPQAD